jgi:hypothetical protein
MDKKKALIFGYGLGLQDYVKILLSIVLGMIADKPLINAKGFIILLQMSMMEKPS